MIEAVENFFDNFLVGAFLGSGGLSTLRVETPWAWPKTFRVETP
jgi:hypothetical protein